MGSISNKRKRLRGNSGSSTKKRSGPSITDTPSSNTVRPSVDLFIASHRLQTTGDIQINSSPSPSKLLTEIHGQSTEKIQKLNDKRRNITSSSLHNDKLRVLGSKGQSSGRVKDPLTKSPHPPLHTENRELLKSSCDIDHQREDDESIAVDEFLFHRKEDPETPIYKRRRRSDLLSNKERNDNVDIYGNFDDFDSVAQSHINMTTHTGHISPPASQYSQLDMSQDLLMRNRPSLLLTPLRSNDVWLNERLFHFIDNGRAYKCLEKLLYTKVKSDGMWSGEPSYTNESKNRVNGEVFTFNTTSVTEVDKFLSECSQWFISTLSQYHSADASPSNCAIDAKQHTQIHREIQCSSSSFGNHKSNINDENSKSNCQNKDNEKYIKNKNYNNEYFGSESFSGDENDTELRPLISQCVSSMGTSDGILINNSNNSINSNSNSTTSVVTESADDIPVHLRSHIAIVTLCAFELFAPPSFSYGVQGVTSTQVYENAKEAALTKSLEIYDSWCEELCDLLSCSSGDTSLNILPSLEMLLRRAAYPNGSPPANLDVYSACGLEEANTLSTFQSTAVLLSKLPNIQHTFLKWLVPHLIYSFYSLKDLTPLEIKLMQLLRRDRKQRGEGESMNVNKEARQHNDTRETVLLTSDGEKGVNNTNLKTNTKEESNVKKCESIKNIKYNKGIKDSNEVSSSNAPTVFVITSQSDDGRRTSNGGILEEESGKDEKQRTYINGNTTSIVKEEGEPNLLLGEVEMKSTTMNGHKPENENKCKEVCFLPHSRQQKRLNKNKGSHNSFYDEINTSSSNDEIVEIGDKDGIKNENKIEESENEEKKRLSNPRCYNCARSHGDIFKCFRCCKSYHEVCLGPHSPEDVNDIVEEKRNKVFDKNLNQKKNGGLNEYLLDDDNFKRTAAELWCDDDDNYVTDASIEDSRLAQRYCFNCRQHQGIVADGDSQIMARLDKLRARGKDVMLYLKEHSDIYGPSGDSTVSSSSSSDCSSDSSDARERERAQFLDISSQRFPVKASNTNDSITREKREEERRAALGLGPGGREVLVGLHGAKIVIGGKKKRCSNRQAFRSRYIDIAADDGSDCGNSKSDNSSSMSRESDRVSSDANSSPINVKESTDNEEAEEGFEEHRIATEKRLRKRRKRARVANAATPVVLDVNGVCSNDIDHTRVSEARTTARSPDEAARHASVASPAMAVFGIGSTRRNVVFGGATSRPSSQNNNNVTSNGTGATGNMYTGSNSSRYLSPYNMSSRISSRFQVTSLDPSPVSDSTKGNVKRQ